MKNLKSYLSNLISQDYKPVFYSAFLYSMLLVSSLFFEVFYLELVATGVLFLIIPYLFARFLDNGIFSTDFIKGAFYFICYFIVISSCFLIFYSVFLDVNGFSVVDFFNPESSNKGLEESMFAIGVMVCLFLVVSVYCFIVLLTSLYNKLVLDFGFKKSLSSAVRFGFFNYHKFAFAFIIILTSIYSIDYLLVKYLDNIYIYIFLSNLIQVSMLCMMFIYLVSMKSVLIENKKPLK